MQTPPIIVAGTVATDDIKTPFGSRKGVMGGSAVFFSIAASHLVPSSIVGIIGHDYPPAFLKTLRMRGIDLSAIVQSASPTFHWSGHYEFDMNVAHTDDTRLGALTEFKPVLNEAQRKAGYIFLANVDPDIQISLLSQVERPQFIGLDSMNFWIDSKPRKLWKAIAGADSVFLNDGEIRQLSGEASLVTAARSVQKRGPRTVIVKKGEHGILAVHQGKVFITSSYPVDKVKDPTGAGDSFAGGYVSYLARHLKAGQKPDFAMVKRAIVWGSAVASFTVEDFSTASLLVTNKNKILSRYRAIRELTHFEESISL